MTELITDAFRTIGSTDAVADGFVVPFYLSDRKLRISVARVRPQVGPGGGPAQLRVPGACGNVPARAGPAPPRCRARRVRAAALQSSTRSQRNP